MTYRGCIALLGLLTLCAQESISYATDAPALPELDRCLAHLNPQVDIGYERIAARCPELVRELQQGAWSAWLPKEWQDPGNDLSTGGLVQLRELIRSESITSARDARPDVQRLRRILSGMGIGDSGESRWSRFKRWLHSTFETPNQAEQQSWFSSMVARVGFTQSLINLVIYVALSAVVVIAGIIVAHELRTAGVWSRRPRVGIPRVKPTDAEGSEQTWTDVRDAPVGEQPRLLLDLIVRRLGALQLLPPASALTVREVARVARLPADDDRARLLELALASEQVRYSQKEVTVESLGRPLARGRELLDQLEAGIR